MVKNRVREHAGSYNRQPEHPKWQAKDNNKRQAGKQEQEGWTTKAGCTIDNLAGN